MSLFNRKGSEEQSSAAGNWTLTLGPLQVVVAVGFATGCVATAYYLGYFSGQKTGLETALANNLATQVRIPFTPPSEEGKTKTEDFSEIYAKLKEPVAPPKKEAKPPELDPVVQEFLASSSSSAPAEKAELSDRTHDQVAKESAGSKFDSGSKSDGLGRGESESGIRVLGGGSTVARNENKTLGELFGGEGEEPIKPTEKVGSPIQDKTAAKSEAAAAKLAKEKEASAAKEKAALKAEKDAQAEKAKKLADKNKEAEKKKASELAQETKAKDQKTSSSLRPGWYAQIAAPRSLQEANATAQALKKSGFAVVVETAKVRDEQYYRVVIGPEDNRQQADRLLQQLKREPSVKSEPFIRMVR